MYLSIYCRMLNQIIYVRRLDTRRRRRAPHNNDLPSRAIYGFLICCYLTRNHWVLKLCSHSKRRRH